MLPSKFGQRKGCAKCCSGRFYKMYLQLSQNHLLWRECVKIHKNTLKLIRDQLFLATCGHGTQCAKSCTTRPRNSVYQTLSQKSQNQFFRLDCVRTCKKSLKFTRDAMFPAKFGQKVRCATSCSARAQNAVFQNVSANKPQPPCFNRILKNTPTLPKNRCFLYNLMKTESLALFEDSFCKAFLYQPGTWLADGRVD